MAQKKIAFVKLGIFVITGSALLLIAAYLIGNEQKMFSKTFTLTTVFENVGGLQIGNNVRYAGINAGTVREITMETDTSIRVFMRIDAALQSHIKKNALAMIGSDGLVGSMILNLVPGSGTAPPVKDGDEVQSFSRISTQDMLNTLNVTNENAALLTADLLEITQSLRRGSGILGRLLTDSVMAGNFQKSLHNLNITTQQSGSALTRLNQIISEMNYDESVWAVLMDNPEAGNQVRAVLSSLDSSAQDIKRVTARLDLLSANVANGSGSLGVVLQDSTAAKNIQLSLEHLESGLEKFDQNMEALKHNFLTRGYFRKQERKDKSD
jgi:phospholipid/cholesterol/gamma-HCH transport system substrate-binding protein